MIPRGQIQIIVRPSLPVESLVYPVTAYIAGSRAQGFGYTVVAALEDLFTDTRAGKLARKLEQEIAALESQP